MNDPLPPPRQMWMGHATTVNLGLCELTREDEFQGEVLATASSSWQHLQSLVRLSRHCLSAPLV